MSCKEVYLSCKIGYAYLLEIEGTLNEIRYKITWHGRGLHENGFHDMEGVYMKMDFMLVVARSYHKPGLDHYVLEWWSGHGHRRCSWYTSRGASSDVNRCGTLWDHCCSSRTNIHRDKYCTDYSRSIEKNQQRNKKLVMETRKPHLLLFREQYQQLSQFISTLFL